MYAVMWLYQFKPEHILGLSSEKNPAQALDTDRLLNEANS